MTQPTPGKTHWLFCDGDWRGSFCIYSEQSANRLKSERCVKHGRILDWAGPKYDGMTREQVRAHINKSREQ